MIKTPTTHKNKELGVLMLLLAADTVADVCATLSTNGVLPKNLAAPLSTELIASRGRDIKLHHNKVSPSYSVTDDSSDGDTDSVGTPVPEANDEVVAEMGSVRWMGDQLDDAALACIMSFTDWRTAVKARQVSRAWFTASLSAVVVCRLPHTKAPAVFIPCRMSMEANVQRDEARLCASSTITTESDLISSVTSMPTSTSATQWVCTHCSAQNLQAQRKCSTCGAHGAATTRIFLGQLRRDATVPMVRWFVEDVCSVPQGALVSVENHCNRATGRGKGCAWAYVEDDNISAQRVLSYHHRAYYDVVGGVEGVWIAHPNQSDSLTKDAATRGAAADRPRYMPRTAMVVELPARPAPSLRSSAPAYAPPPPPMAATAWSQPYTTPTDSAAPPTYMQFANESIALWNNTVVSCWDQNGRAARRFNPYGSIM